MQSAINVCLFILCVCLFVRDNKALQWNRSSSELNVSWPFQNHNNEFKDDPPSNLIAELYEAFIRSIKELFNLENLSILLLLVQIIYYVGSLLILFT